MRAQRIRVAPVFGCSPNSRATRTPLAPGAAGADRCRDRLPDLPGGGFAGTLQQRYEQRGGPHGCRRAAGCDGLTGGYGFRLPAQPGAVQLSAGSRQSGVPHGRYLPSSLCSPPAARRAATSSGTRAATAGQFAGSPSSAGGGRACWGATETAEALTATTPAAKLACGPGPVPWCETRTRTRAGTWLGSMPSSRQAGGPQCGPPDHTARSGQLPPGHRLRSERIGVRGLLPISRAIRITAPGFRGSPHQVPYEDCGFFIRTAWLSGHRE